MPEQEKQIPLTLKQAMDLEPGKILFFMGEHIERMVHSVMFSYSMPLETRDKETSVDLGRLLRTFVDHVSILTERLLDGKLVQDPHGYVPFNKYSLTSR